MAATQPYGGRVFRASPAWELIVWDRLGPDERRLLAEVARDPSFYGVLRPLEGNGRSVRAVDRDTALLFLTLREPAALPSFATTDGDGSIADLVLDGVLEVRDGDVFHTGSAGAALLTEAGAGPAKPGGRSLSLAALEYAAALRLADARALAARLYNYNRLPVTPAWAERLPDAQAVLRFLDLDDTGDWRLGGSAGGAWIHWSRGRGPGVARSHCKLYVSPAPAALPAALRTLLQVLERGAADQFKLGGDAAGVLRPDKLVVYFADRASLAATAHALAERLGDVPAHGVPFTSPVTDDGLLSWGVDPPPESRPMSWLPGESWRSWLVRELASGLLPSGEAPAPVEPVLDRLRRRGVDVERWMPSGTLWREVEV